MTEIREKIEKISKILATMLDYLGLNAQVGVEEVDGKLVLNIASEDAGRIIGKRGQTLQSLELLINRIAAKSDENSSWISISVDGYSTTKNNNRGRKRSSKSFEPRRERGHFRKESSSGRFDRKRNRDYDDNENGSGISDEERLKQQALDAAKEVKRWGEPVTLPPMNSHERRVIHMALKEDTGVKTESSSVGDSDRLKTVTICVNDNKDNQ